METVTATGRVQRTVRVAVALVVGHALLGALIGWITLGTAPSSAPRAGSQAVDGLGTPPPRGAPPGRRASRDGTVTARRFEPVRDREPRVSRTAPAPRVLAGAPGLVPVLPAPSPSSPVPQLPAAPAAPLPSSPAPAKSAAPSASPSPTATPTPTPTTTGDSCLPDGTIGPTADTGSTPCGEDLLAAPTA